MTDEMFIGVLSLLVGYFLTLWGWRYSRRPDRLNPGSLPYWVLIPWWRRRKTERSPGTPSDEEIKIQAGRSLVVGILLVVVGILAVIMGVMQVLFPIFD